MKATSCMIKFEANEKKVRILNFKIDVFLKSIESQGQQNLPIKLRKNELTFY